MLGAATAPAALGLLRLALGEYGRFPALAHTLWDMGPALSYGRFQAFLRDRAEAGELEVDDYQLAAEHFIAALVGHIQLKLAMGKTAPLTPEEVERRVAAAVRVFLRAYGAAAADPVPSRLERG